MFRDFEHLLVACVDIEEPSTNMVSSILAKLRIVAEISVITISVSTIVLFLRVLG